METNLLTNLLNGILALTSLFIALRAFVRFFQLHSPRLLILGLAMTTIALTAAADTASSMITILSLNTDWFLYIGQTVSLGFIFLSLFPRSERPLRRLLLWQIMTIVPLLALLVLSPILPDFPTPLFQVSLSGARALVCFLIFNRYVASFITIKETLFGFLMSAAFLLLSIGYLLILPKLVLSHMDLLDHIGDVIRIMGLVTLLAAYARG